MQLLGLLLRVVVGVARKGFDQPGAVHPDRAMDPPRLDRDAGLLECARPGVHVQVVGIDEGAVNVEQHRGLGSSAVDARGSAALNAAT